MGKTCDDGSQQAMWVATADLPQGGETMAVLTTSFSRQGRVDNVLKGHS